MPADFHEVRFPLDIAFGASGGPVRRTDVVLLASGREHRNARWADSRRRYDAGLGIRTLDAMHQVLAFFEERRGRLYGFRFRDRADWRSGPPGSTPTALDCLIATGDGSARTFALTKTYGSSFAPYVRLIGKPVAGTVRVAVAGVELTPDAFGCDAAAGAVTLATAPAPGIQITAGFAFDVPVRFDTDALAVDLAGFEAGAVPTIPLVEITL